jgi:hypothetical protein
MYVGDSIINTEMKDNNTNRFVIRSIYYLVKYSDKFMIFRINSNCKKLCI